MHRLSNIVKVFVTLEVKTKEGFHNHAQKQGKIFGESGTEWTGYRKDH